MSEAIQNLKSFHNWVKSQQLQRYISSHQVIVDIGCGKGGDLHKFAYLYPKRLLGIDVNEFHLQEARTRYSTLSNKHHFGTAEFVLGDLRKTETYAKLIADGHLNQPNSVDVFNCQNALTYFTDTLSTLKNLVHWIATFLKPGGYWIGSCVDGDKIVQLLQKTSNTNQYNNSCGKIQLVKAAPADRTVQKRVDTGPQASAAVQASATASAAALQSTCGTAVQFELYHSILGEQGVLEYLVDFDTLTTVAASEGLRLVETLDFETWYNELYDQSNLSVDEMTFSFLSRSFVFQKIYNTEK